MSTIRFPWSVQNIKAGQDELEDWAGGYAVFNANPVTGFDFASGLITILMEADKMVAAAKARASLGGAPQEQIDALLGQINALVPGVTGPPLGSLQAEATKYGVGEMYSFAQNYVLLVFRDVGPWRGNSVRDRMLVDWMWPSPLPKMGPSAWDLGLDDDDESQLGLLPPLIVGALGVAGIIASTWLIDSQLKDARKTKVLMKTTMAHYAERTMFGLAYNKNAAATGKPFLKPSDFPELKGAEKAVEARERAPWVAAGAAGALALVGIYSKTKRRRAQRRALPAAPARVTNPGRRRAAAKRRRRNEAGVKGRGAARVHKATGRKTVQDWGSIHVMEGPRGGKRYAAQIPPSRAGDPNVKSAKGRHVWVYQVGDWRGSGRTRYYPTLKALKSAHPGKWRRVNPVVYLSKRDMAEMVKFMKLGANAAERASMETRDTRVAGALSHTASEGRAMAAKLKAKGGAKRNPAHKKKAKKGATASRCKKCKAGSCTVHGKRASYGHDKRPAQYKGLRRDQFAYPDRWMYPVNTKKRTQAAARFFGKYCDRYPQKMRREIARNIDRAEKRFKIGKYAA